MLRSDFVSDKEFRKIVEISKDLPTPCILINIEKVENKYKELESLFHGSDIHYAVKANPSDEVINSLRKLGSHFDVASVYELKKLLDLGVQPNKILYGNTIKKAKDIEFFYKNGVRLFATDCEADIRNISEYAPGSKIYVRIIVQGDKTADWPLSRKFGCHPDKALFLIELASKIRLIPYGISFHVGSQQRDIGQWNEAITSASHIFMMAKKKGINLEMINLGGGLPARYISKTREIKDYAEEINSYIYYNFDYNFDGKIPKVILEPGRSLVADSGVLVTEVVMASRKSHTDMYRWVYTDTGKFNGLIETMDECIKFPIVYEDRYHGPLEEVILAGPTCDSMDVMYENHKYMIPADISQGDRLYLLTAGAYTQSYASIAFNGFPPIKTYVFNSW